MTLSLTGPGTAVTTSEGVLARRLTRLSALLQQLLERPTRDREDEILAQLRRESKAVRDLRAALVVQRQEMTWSSIRQRVGDCGTCPG
jgi:hypothetical protein